MQLIFGLVPNILFRVDKLYRSAALWEEIPNSKKTEYDLENNGVNGSGFYFISDYEKNLIKQRNLAGGKIYLLPWIWKQIKKYNDPANEELKRKLQQISAPRG